MGKGFFCFLGVGMITFTTHGQERKPNILYIMSDDHTSQAVSCYGGILSNVLPTPNIDRIASDGAKLTNCFVTNSISTPSRAAIITGQYSQKNGVYTLCDRLEKEHPNVAKCLQQSGYQTAIVGKWHLNAEPAGFDYYNVLPGQGNYQNPILIEKGMWDVKKNGIVGKEYQGHSTDIIANEAIHFIDNREKEKPFFLMCHFKAPHRRWQPAERFKKLLEDVEIPEPDNLLDNYEGKGQYAQLLQMSMENLDSLDLKVKMPEQLTRDEQRHWAYQLYIKDYLRCVAGVDENVGRILDYLDENGLTENTIVIYTGDQGFFLGEHGWFDKRLMYEESLRMPFVIRYPKEISPGTVLDDLVLNIDFAPLFLDYAGDLKPNWIQGESFRPNLLGKTSVDWRQSIYYRYWMHGDGSHNAVAHYGIRTHRNKLIFYYGLPLDKTCCGETSIQPAEWELYDLIEDPKEMHNVYNDPHRKELIKRLKTELLQLKYKYEDEDINYPEMKDTVDKYYW